MKDCKGYRFSFKDVPLQSDYFGDTLRVPRTGVLIAVRLAAHRG